MDAKGSVRRGGRAPASSLIRILRQLFRHAVKTGRLESLAHSPAELLDDADFGIGASEPRDRALSGEELAAVFLHREVDLPGLIAGRPGIEFGLSESVRAAIILRPHLAVRPAALVGLRWDEVHLDKARATIRGGRGAKLKHGAKARGFVVPISSTALEVLSALYGRCGDSPWVLPSESAAGHLTGDVLADALKRLNARLGLPGGPVWPHDARRTFTAAAERLGVSKLVVGGVLQHSLGKVGNTYFVGDDAETRRKATSWWTRTGQPSGQGCLREWCPSPERGHQTDGDTRRTVAISLGSSVSTAPGNVPGRLERRGYPDVRQTSSQLTPSSSRV